METTQMTAFPNELIGRCLDAVRRALLASHPYYPDQRAAMCKAMQAAVEHAGAPELRDALQGIMQWWMTTPEFDEGTDEMPAQVFDAARDALDKAIGQGWWKDSPTTAKGNTVSLTRDELFDLEYAVNNLIDDRNEYCTHEEGNAGFVSRLEELQATIQGALAASGKNTQSTRGTCNRYIVEGKALDGNCVIEVTDSPSFYGVYDHDAEGLRVWIADFDQLDHARAFARLMEGCTSSNQGMVAAFEGQYDADWTDPGMAQEREVWEKAWVKARAS
jgi:hypothetical protein